MRREMWEEFKIRWIIFAFVAKKNILLALPVLFFPTTKSLKRIEHIIDPEE
jgi:hypothetical protein